jgi:uncharacterized membrane protein YpjA
MSNPAAPVFFGVFLVLFLMVKYWKLIVLAIIALVVTGLFAGASQLVSLVKDQAAVEVVESPAQRN